MGAVVKLKARQALKTGQLQRPANAALRSREWLTPAEVEKLVAAARKRGRNGARDALAILLTYRHGLRVSELCGLLWASVDFAHQRLHVARRKGGLDSVQPLTGAELRALRALRRENPHGAHVLMTEREAPMSADGFRKMLGRTAEEAGLVELRVHPHMLRHATGYKLANDGTDTRTIQAYLGHANIQHTTRYTALAADRFRGLFKD